MIFYCKHKGYKVSVGSLHQDPDNGQWMFVKHKPHLMRVIGPNGGYGIQKQLIDENGNIWHLKEIFKKHPNIKVIITDNDTGITWHSLGQDWLEHFHTGNYGDGTQLFLSTDYMTKEGQELWR